MSVLILARLINSITYILVILISIWAILSWILPPYHPVREALDRIMDPLLAPIRRVMPLAGPMDFSPMILAILILLISQVLINVVLLF